MIIWQNGLAWKKIGDSLRLGFFFFLYRVIVQNWGMRMRKIELIELDCQSWEGEGEPKRGHWSDD